MIHDMKNIFKTEQEQFWNGNFGDEYINRNQGEEIIASNIAMFTKVLVNTLGIKSVIEFGANIGLNLRAIKCLLPYVEISAIEINNKASATLEEIGWVKVYNQSILDWIPDYCRDLVLMAGILIHINPDVLPQVYDLIYQTSKRYICIAEYYNPRPIEVIYRGHQGKLFKRDFAGEMLDKFKDLQLLDYGFIYHRDNQFPQDDVNWFLLEKTGCV